MLTRRAYHHYRVIPTLFNLVPYHAKAIPPHLDQETPLSQKGRDIVSLLKNDLTCLNLTPDIYLTSSHIDARETAEILSSQRVNLVHSIDVLNPDRSNSNNIFQTIIEQAESKGVGRQIAGDTRLGEQEGQEQREGSFSSL